MSSSRVCVSAACSGDEAMEYGLRGPPRVPMSTAWPGLNSNGCSRRSSVRRRERGVSGATLTSGTDTVATRAKCTRRPTSRSGDRRAVLGSGARLHTGGGELPLHVAPAGALVLIHPPVGGGEQRLVGLAVMRVDRGADADRHRHRRAGRRLEHDLLDPALQFAALVLRLVAAAARQHDDEFVAAIPAEQAEGG